MRSISGRTNIRNRGDCKMNGPANQPASGFSFNGPTIISLLYLAGFLGVGLTGLVGLILCYVWRGEARPAWELNHFTFHIRTFWIAFVAGIIGFILSFILIGIPILIGLAV